MQIQKAAPAQVAPAATFTAAQVAAMVSALNVAGGQVAQPLPRTVPQVPFGPGLPIQVGTIDPLRDDTQRPEPRIYEYPVTINLPGQQDRLVPWKVLRDAAEIPVVRDCIRIRKNEVAALEWDIVVSRRAAQAQRRTKAGVSSVEVEREMRERLAPEADRLRAFWEQPDWQQGENFVEWCTKLLEEHLVLDAVAIYPFKNIGGDRLGLRLLDGSTIKPLLDNLGGRPSPPNPAYQQLLWGFPRGEYTADVDAGGEYAGQAFPADRLIYKRREVRTHSPYGLSAVEQALTDVDLYLRRHEWDKAQYTDGVQPAGWILNEGVESWSPQQLADYNRAFNDMYAGHTLARMRYHLLPPGMKPSESTDVAEKYKPDYHLHLIKLVAMHFDVTLAELGFTESKGLGSSGYHEGQENVQERKATNPTLVWLQGLLTQISRAHLGMPEELEFKFLGLDSEDQNAADEVISRQFREGRLTFNEAREEMGRPPYDFDEANMPVVETSRGIVFIENASKLVPAGEEITPMQAPPTPAPEGVDAEPDPDPDAADEPPGADAATKSTKSGRSPADQVYAQLREDFPKSALGWVKDASWSGPQQVALDRVDWSNEEDWKASHEPARVEEFERRIPKGDANPVVLVRTPNNRKLIVVDGHHRALAYRNLKTPVTAWVGRVESARGPWDQLHNSQYPKKGDAAKGELAAYWKWLRNGHTTTRRPFEFWHVTKTEAMLNDIDLATVTFKAVGDSPKAPGRHWPAWDQDQRASRWWTRRVREVLTGLPTRQIADRWLAARKDATVHDRRQDAEQWLLTLGVTLAPRLTRLLTDLWVDGYLLGDKSAQALLADVEHVDWAGWEPGDTAATRLLITTDGADIGLQQLLVDADRVASGINSTRIRSLARALTDALERDTITVDDLDAELHALLDDESTAERIASTEVARASNTAALARYDTARLDGVTGVIWLAGANSCERCLDNAAAGPVPIGQAFPSGARTPPQHPWCGCALIPDYTPPSGAHLI